MAKIEMSEKWMVWISDYFNLKTCLECRMNHGKIISREDTAHQPPAHENCRCYTEPLPAVEAGTGTNDGTNGADWFLLHYGYLPDYYITKQEARDLGWVKQKCNLHLAAPDKIIGGDIYHNRDGRLPSAPNRMWYEADINYEGGCRNTQRVVYSNDGLIFVTYTHYLVFFEVV